LLKASASERERKRIITKLPQHPPAGAEKPKDGEIQQSFPPSASGLRPSDIEAGSTIKWGATDPVDLLQSMQVLSLKPGDVLVVSCDRHITADMGERLVDLVRRFVPDNKIMVLESGLTIGVLRSEDMTAAEKDARG
jgi:hypothetical protein